MREEREIEKEKDKLKERKRESEKEREGGLYDSMCNNQSRRLKFIKGLNCQRHFSIWKAEAAFHRKFGTNCSKQKVYLRLHNQFS